MILGKVCGGHIGELVIYARIWSFMLQIKNICSKSKNYARNYGNML